jgi:hypothetical protein
VTRTARLSTRTRLVVATVAAAQAAPLHAQQAAHNDRHHKVAQVAKDELRDDEETEVLLRVCGCVGADEKTNQ